jgi:hypothetical protein
MQCKSPACGALLLVGSVGVSAVLVVPWAYAAEQMWGVWSAIVACGTCCGGGLVALGLARLYAGPANLLSRVLTSMLARTGVPLLVCGIVYFQGGRLAEAGFVYYLLAFYFVVLVVETVLLVGDVPSQVTEKPTV